MTLYYGVLVLNTGQTYGRLKTKLLYKCVPEDKSLPRVVLVPYHDRDKVEFSKDRVNKFITFTLHANPVVGTLRNVLGDVNNVEDYLQYRLQSQRLATSSLKPFLEALKPCGSVYPSGYLLQGLEDRSGLEVYSIDPAGCQDMDDALGLQDADEFMSGMVTVYIANVPLLLDRLNLWPHLSERTSTIYLPDDKNIPMLPPLLSDNWCSLHAQQERLALAMDVCLVKGQIIDVAVKPVVVKVTKNCAYDDPVLPAMIEKLLQMTIYLNEVYPFVHRDALLSLKKDDQMHKLVEYWMLFMNFECCKLLFKKGTGLFKGEGARPPNPPGVHEVALPPEYQHLLKAHAPLLYSALHLHGGWGAAPPAEPPSFVHITSPIRRLVDLVNMTFLQEDVISEQGIAVASQWLLKVDYINQQTKATRKVQNEALLLSLFAQDNARVYEGCVVEAISFALDQIKYSVYIPALKLWSSFKSRDKEIAPFTLRQFTLFVFLKETQLTRKIRLQLLGL